MFVDFDSKPSREMFAAELRRGLAAFAGWPLSRVTVSTFVGLVEGEKVPSISVLLDGKEPHPDDLATIERFFKEACKWDGQAMDMSFAGPSGSVERADD